MTDLDEAAAKAEGAEGNGVAEDGGNAAAAFLRGSDESAEDYARRIFRRVFEKDIAIVLSMEVGPCPCCCDAISAQRLIQVASPTCSANYECHVRQSPCNLQQVLGKL